MMSLSGSAVIAPVQQAVPRFVPDLRPSADAAATLRETRPATAVALPPVAPPSPTQTAAISRSMVTAVRGTDGTGAPAVGPPERTLKPYGVAMLPHAFREGGAAEDTDTPSETPPPAARSADPRPALTTAIDAEAAPAPEPALQEPIQTGAEAKAGDSAAQATRAAAPEAEVAPETDSGRDPETKPDRD